MPRQYKVKSKSKNIIRSFVVMVVALMLAFFVGLQVFIYVQPPIKNLSDFRPGLVTKIYDSTETEVIKTFTASQGNCSLITCERRLTTLQIFK